MVKNPPANAEGMALIPGSGNSPRVGNALTVTRPVLVPSIIDI